MLALYLTFVKKKESAIIIILLNQFHELSRYIFGNKIWGWGAASPQIFYITYKPRTTKWYNKIHSTQEDRLHKFTDVSFVKLIITLNNIIIVISDTQENKLHYFSIIAIAYWSLMNSFNIIIMH